MPVLSSWKPESDAILLGVQVFFFFGGYFQASPLYWLGSFNPESDAICLGFKRLKQCQIDGNCSADSSQSLEEQRR